uniref:Uncharacterized protein n=1 Tax=Timema bartmani TaxID=61472 RepID=A0A7R9I1P8_9NEOP|nr:unnamed protein product [Timema bartmani]
MHRKKPSAEQKSHVTSSKPINRLITLSSSDEEDHENSNCKDFFTTKQDANTFQNNILDLVVAVSAHKEKPKDDSDRETVIERISKMTTQTPLYIRYNPDNGATEQKGRGGLLEYSGKKHAHDNIVLDLSEQFHLLP